MIHSVSQRLSYIFIAKILYIWYFWVEKLFFWGIIFRFPCRNAIFITYFERFAPNWEMKMVTFISFQV